MNTYKKKDEYLKNLNFKHPFWLEKTVTNINDNKLV